MQNILKLDYSLVKNLGGFYTTEYDFLRDIKFDDKILEIIKKYITPDVIKKNFTPDSECMPDEYQIHFWILIENRPGTTSTFWEPVSFNITYLDPCIRGASIAVGERNPAYDFSDIFYLCYADQTENPELENDIYNFVEEICKKLITILKDRDKYNEFVINNLPYDHRDGFLSAKEYIEICPEERIFKTSPEELDIVEENHKRTRVFPALNFKGYAEIWVRAYEAGVGQIKEAKPGETSLEKFCRLKGFDIPSPKEAVSPKYFYLIHTARSSFEIYDLVYKSVRLSPTMLLPSTATPFWEFHLYVDDIYWADAVMKISLELGDIVTIDWRTILYEVIKYEDTRCISYIPFDRKMRFGTGYHIINHLPEEDEPEKRRKIIEKTDWSKPFGLL